MSKRLVRVPRKVPGGEQSTNSPSQEDEADILAEVEAKQDDNGEFTADEKKVEELGAIDAATVRENRMQDDAIKKKRANMPGVPFNSSDPLAAYEALIKIWPANTIDITVRRLTGTPVTRTIISRPRSGVEFYEAMMGQVHGLHEEASYEVKFLDSNLKQYRATTRITLPDTRGAAPPLQQGQPVYQPPPGYPPGYQPPPPGYFQQQPTQYAQPQQPQPQAQQPVVQVVPPQAPPFDPGLIMTIMGQMQEMFLRGQASAQPPPPPQFIPPPQPVFAPPPMPSSSDPAAVTAWIGQLGELFQRMQPQPQQQPVQMPPPVVQVTPPPTPAIDPLVMFREVLGLVQQVQAAALPPAQPPAAEYRRSSYSPQGRPPGPRYAPQDDDQDRSYGRPSPYATAPAAPPKTPAEHFRESLTGMKAIMETVQEFTSFIPGQQQQQREYEPTEPEEDDNPIRIVNTGAGKIAFSKSDGSIRKFETGVANLGNILNWASKEAEKFRQTQQQRQQPPQHPTRSLPTGYVEVHPGYQPPPGFVAVPEAPPPSNLPPPPTQVPPPIQASPAPPKTWDMPVISSEGEG